MIMEIGIIAGEIWNLLEKKGTTESLANMQMELKKPKEHILMSLGWLAREGHVMIQPQGEEYFVRLIRKD